MFETEDMLPRAAPKPTSLGPNEPAVKPTVPEVSILFNQAATATSNNNPMQQNKPPVQSYASWRKQMLPKVTYPPGAENASAAENAVVKSNLYPMRTVPTAAFTTSNNNGNCAYAYMDRNESRAQQQRRSLESYAPVYSNAHITAVTASSNPNLVQMHQQEQYMRRSLETLPVQRSVPPTAMPQTPIIRPITSTEVLTICAGTQTDSIGLSTQCNSDVATKQDFQHMLGILQEMRLEQKRLTEICVLLMEQQQRLQPTLTEKKEPSLKNASTQYDEAVQATCQQRDVVLIKDYHTAEHYEVQQPPPNNYHQKCLPNVQQQQTQQNNQNFQSPRVRPAAHSTGYRQNSPLINNIPQQHQNQPPQNVMSKPATEQSMVMNELALKYLPNDKLNEMLQEMRLSPAQQKVINDVDYGAAATAIPLRNIENIDKELNDISNASYKYLKKYRLLPEEQQLQQQQKQQFQREQSPLAGHPRAMQEQLLDLDAIRRQPKFL